MKAYKLPSGNYRVQVMVDGVSESFTEPTKDMAIAKAIDWKCNQRSRRNPDNETIGDALKDYIDTRTNILSPVSIEAYKSICRRYFTQIKDMKLSKFKQSDCQKLVNEMAGRGLAPKTIRCAYGLLKSACGFNYSVALPPPIKTEYKTPDAEGIKMIINRTSGTPIEIPVLLALVCGMRMGEIRGLRYQKVSPSEIIVDTEIVDVAGERIEKRPKTKESVRRIRIPSWLYDRIQSQPHQSGDDHITNLSSRAIYHRFVKLTDGICRFHDLRHANASVMMMLGVPDSYAMERGGWETESIYKKTYVQTQNEGRDLYADMISNYFESLMKI